MKQALKQQGFVGVGRKQTEWAAWMEREKEALTEIAVGQPADLTVFDLNETYTVDPETFLTMGRATPFAGTCLTGACKLTMIGGKIVWKEDTL